MHFEPLKFCYCDKVSATQLQYTIEGVKTKK